MEQLPDHAIKPDSKIIHLDLNLARLPLVHIRGSKNAPWSIKIDGALVEGNRRLTRRELAVFTEVLSLFEKAKMPENGTFFGHTQNGLTREIVMLGGGSKSAQKNIGGFEKKRLKNYISNINKTFFSFNGSYQENGRKVTSMVSFSLLEEAILCEREHEDHFFLSRFRLPKPIVDNMRAGFWKPLKIAVISHFKSEKALALWMLLDRMLSVREDFNKDLKDLCHEIGINFTRERNYVSQMKKVCRSVIHVPLTNGQKIKLCHIEPSQSPSGFKLVALRGDAKTVERQPPDSKIENKPLSADEREIKILFDWYKCQDKEVWGEIDAAVEGIAKELFKTYWKKPLSLEKARIEAVRRAYLHEVACKQIITNANQKLLTLREPPCQNPYRGDGDVMGEIFASFRAMLTDRFERVFTSVFCLEKS